MRNKWFKLAVAFNAFMGFWGSLYFSDPGLTQRTKFEWIAGAGSWMLLSFGLAIWMDHRGRRNR